MDSDDQTKASSPNNVEEARFELYPGQWDGFFRATSTVFLVAVMCIALSSIIFTLWAIGDLNVGQFLRRLGGLVFSSIAVGELLMRVPRAARRAPATEDLELSRVARTMMVAVPRMVLYGPSDRPRLEVRGRGNFKHEVTMLVAPMTMILWRRNPEAKTGQIAHELAHVVGADTFLYSRIGALLIINVGLLSINIVPAVRGGTVTNVALFVLIIVLGVIAWRYYSRIREHSADVIASLAIGRMKYRDLLVGSAATPSTHRWSIPVLQSHPSLRERLSVLEDPSRLSGSIAIGFLTLGFGLYVTRLAIFLCLQHFSDDPPWWSIYAADAAGALILLLATSRLIKATWSIYRTWGVQRWFQAVLATSVLSELVLAEYLVDWSGLILAAFCAVVVLVVAFIADLLGPSAKVLTLGWFGIMALVDSGKLANVAYALSHVIGLQ